MSKPSYYEQLRDMRWQQKRLEILKRDDWMCSDCGRSEGSTLNVHHRYYVKGRAPWEYPDNALASLCEQCHYTTEQKIIELRALAQLDGSATLDAALGFARAMASTFVEGPKECDIESDSVIDGIATYFGLRSDVVAVMCIDMTDGRRKLDLAATWQAAREDAERRAANRG